MTLSSDGCATLAYRVSIDGSPSSPVTHPEMVAAGSAGVPARVEGLILAGQEFSVQADPLTGKLTVGSLSIEVADIDQAWSAVFGKQPDHTTWLTADVNASATTITVASTAGFASSGYIWVDSECIAYTTLGAGGTTFEGCTRGSLSDDADAATYHYAASSGENRRSPEVTDWPVKWEGRRVRIYRYDETQLLSGNGTQCFLGAIVTDPRSKATSWSFDVDSIASVLDQTLGADLSVSSYPRGIVYPIDDPLVLVIQEGSTTGFGGTFSAATVTLGGVFYESQQTFVEALNAAITAAQSGASQTNLVNAVNDGDAVGWHLEYTTLAGGSAKAIRLGYRVGGRPGNVSRVDSAFGGPNGQPQTAAGSEVDTVSGSTKYYFWPSPNAVTGSGITPHFTSPTGIPGAGTVPRGIFSVTYSTSPIYLGGAAPLSSIIDSIMIEWQPTAEGSDKVSDTYTIESYSTGDRAFQVSGLDYSLGDPTTAIRFFTSYSMPSIRFGLRLAPEVLTPSTYYFLRAINQLQQQFSPLGVVPMFREADWDSVTWRQVAHAGQGPLVTRRYYSTFSPVSLGAVVRPELMLAQTFLAVNSSGQLVPKRLRLPVASEAALSATVDEETLLTDETLLSLETSGLGQVNEIVMPTDYDPQSDKYEGRTIKVRDVAAFGQSPSVRSVKIEVKSEYTGPPITDDDAVRCAAGIFGAFAGPYQIYTRDVAIHPSVEVGDAVVFDDPHLVDSNGAVGVTGKVGLVLGVKRGAYSPRTTLTMLMTPQRAGGYAPSADVDSASDKGGDVWDVTVDDALFPTGTDASDWFAVDDRVRVIEMNTATATIVVGTVASASASVVTVAFDGVWGGQASGTGLWYLTIADSDDASLVEAQKRFTHIADSAGVVDYATDDKPAFRMGS